MGGNWQIPFIQLPLVKTVVDIWHKPHLIPKAKASEMLSSPIHSRKTASKYRFTQMISTGTRIQIHLSGTGQQDLCRCTEYHRLFLWTMFTSSAHITTPGKGAQHRLSQAKGKARWNMIWVWKILLRLSYV